MDNYSLQVWRSLWHSTDRTNSISYNSVILKCPYHSNESVSCRVSLPAVQHVAQATWEEEDTQLEVVVMVVVVVVIVAVAVASTYRVVMLQKP